MTKNETGSQEPGSEGNVNEETENFDITNLEDNYQTKKVFVENKKIEAEIVKAGCVKDNLPDSVAENTDEDYVYNIYLVIKISGSVNYTVRVKNRFDSNRGDVIDIYQLLGLEIQEDMSNLSGEEVIVNSNNSSSRDIITIHGSDKEIETIVADDSIIKDLSSSLPSSLVTALSRGQQYKRADNDTCGVTLCKLSTNKDEGTVVLHFESKWGEISLPPETDHGSNPNTDYERLIERVGRGSVEQVSGSQVYFTHIDNIHMPDDAVDREVLNAKMENSTFQEAASIYAWNSTKENYVEKYYGEKYILIHKDELAKWVMFATEPDAGPVNKTTILLGYIIGVTCVITGMFAGIGPFALIGLLVTAGTTFLDGHYLTSESVDHIGLE